MGPTSLMTAGYLLLCSITMVEPAKILFLYPIPYTSHYLTYSSLLKELAKRGHQITAYTTIPGEKSDDNFQHINIDVDLKKLPTPLNDDETSWRFGSSISFIHRAWSCFHPVTEAALQSKELQALMQSEEKFDLMIIEALANQESMLAFSHKFNVPVVTLHALVPGPWKAHLMGIPHSFSYIPDLRLPYSDRMSFWQRTTNALLGMYEIALGNLWYLPIQEKMIRKHFIYPGSENIPSLKQLISNISLHVINSHHLMGYVRPYTPHIINVAGMNIKITGQLPQDLLKFMDEATEGVIYFSFGSLLNPQLLSKQFQDVLIETLKGVKQRVIMKWNGTIAGAPHILARTWLPQLEILAHPNCKLFITHGGYNGLTEAMAIGVPTIGVPFYLDQHHNVAWYEQKGIGLEVDYYTTTVADFTEKINRIIQTSTFRENAKQVAELYRDEPDTSLEKAVYWVEYVIRHKGAHHLKPASVKMPYYQYLLLDVIAFLTLSVFLGVYFVYYLFCKIVALFTGTLRVSGGKKRR